MTSQNKTARVTDSPPASNSASVATRDHCIREKLKIGLEVHRSGKISLWTSVCAFTFYFSLFTLHFALSLISKSLGQSFPVTKSLPLASSYAIPFKTASSSCTSPGESSPAKLIQPTTLPVFGSMRTIRSLCQMLAKISPCTYSSSFISSTGACSSSTAIVLVTWKLSGSRNRILFVPSLRINDWPSFASPQPSPVYLNSPVFFEGQGVINEAQLMLPGQLVDLSLQQRYAFGKVRRWNINLLHYSSGLRLHAS